MSEKEIKEQIMLGVNKAREAGVDIPEFILEVEIEDVK